MIDALQHIISFFSEVEIDHLKINESYTEVSVLQSCANGKVPHNNDLNLITQNLSSRDSLHISILRNEEVVDNFDSSISLANFNHFVENCLSDTLSDPFDIKITIVKNNVEQRISVYYPDSFIDYISNLEFTFFLDLIQTVQQDASFIIFEVQDEEFIDIYTESIKFLSIRTTYIENQRNRQSYSKIKNVCFSNIISSFEFTPSDFYLLTNDGNQKYRTFFTKASIIYSIVYLFDIVNVSNNDIEYKINGYKTINHTISTNDIDLLSMNVYYEIYKWVYDGGNLIDKIGLTRNIISLNFSQDNLMLPESTFDSIKSSFIIYQKENIKQYIEIRNKISEQILIMQEKAEKIVESYVSDYKKSFLAVVSFYISVVAIRVVSKGDFSGGFTFEVLLLSIGFLLIFLLIMFYSRYEIKTQIEKYKKVYQNLKSRYTDLLDPSDIIRILNNDADHISNLKHIEDRKRQYTQLWIASLVILLIISIILYLFNNYKTLHPFTDNITIRIIISIKAIINAL